MTASQDRAETLVKRITERAREAASDGVKQDAFALATAAVLAGQLAQALERIAQLEADLQTLTSMVAELEAQQ